MSEYQYYEFQKLDGRLTEIQMRELRSCSSRAEITPTSFTNEYDFGSFKGNADAWMERYFDGFLYLANWGSREVQLAVPASVLSRKTAGAFCSGHRASCREQAGKLILTFRTGEEPSGEWIESDGLLASLLLVRDELAQGDLRSLYLGWLMRVQAGEIDDADTEPPLPPNLVDLSRPQATLARLFTLNPDLLAVAAQNSPRVQPNTASSEAMAAWVAALPAKEKDGLLLQVMQGNANRLGLELQARFRQQRTPGPVAPGPKPRTAAELWSAAEAFCEERKRVEQERAIQEKVRQAQQAALAREKHLDALKGRDESLWTTVDTLIATRLPKSYDEAARHLIDLRDLARREGREPQFSHRLTALRDQHAAKKSFLTRLQESGL